MPYALFCCINVAAVERHHQLMVAAFRGSRVKCVYRAQYSVVSTSLSLYLSHLGSVGGCTYIIDIRKTSPFMNVPTLSTPNVLTNGLHVRIVCTLCMYI